MVPVRAIGRFWRWFCLEPGMAAIRAVQILGRGRASTERLSHKATWYSNQDGPRGTITGTVTKRRKSRNSIAAVLATADHKAREFPFPSRDEQRVLDRPGQSGSQRTEAGWTASVVPNLLRCDQ